MVNLAIRTCPVCTGPITGRSDRKACSTECKREMKREYDREYARVHAARKTAAAVAWQKANRERKQAYDAEYRERTREHRLAMKRIYERQVREANPDEYRIRARLSSRRRQTLLDSFRFDVTPRDVARILSRQRGACNYCPAALDETSELDHVMPISRGGAHSVGNLVFACRSCNRGKAHRTVMEWRTRKVVPRSLTVL